MGPIGPQASKGEGRGGGAEGRTPFKPLKGGFEGEAKGGLKSFEGGGEGGLEGFKGASKSAPSGASSAARAPDGQVRV